jgi:ATP-binding cassette subfamily B protein
MLALVYFQRLIDSIGELAKIDNIMSLLLTYGALQLTDYILSYIDNYPDSILKNGFYYHFKIMAMKKISTIAFLKYKEYGTGELIQMVENGADAGRNILFQFYLNIFRNILPSIVIGMVFVGVYDYKVLIAISISYVLVFFITKLLLKKLYDVKNTTLINDEILSSKIVRGFMEMVVFRLNRRYKKEMDECKKRASKIVKSKTKILMIHELFFTSFAIIVTFIKIIAILIGIKQIYIGASTVGSIVVLIAFIDRIYAPIAIFNVEYIDYKLNQVAFKRYESFMCKDDEKMLGYGDKVRLYSGDIEIESIEYDFDGNKVLDGVSMRFESSKSYALVGKSGTGKTTLLNILAGLLKVDSNKVWVDGNDLSKIDLLSYYEDIAYLSQNPAVFDGTIRENLIFDMEIPDEKLFDILKKVNLYERIMSMEEGLDTRIGERGSMLSGGEKQRLAMARIMLQKPNIVLLDEPTSALDSINQESILGNLFGELKDSTIIAVTHRVHTTYMFDNVVLLDNGKIKDIGTMQELLLRDELFRELYESDKDSSVA